MVRNYALATTKKTHTKGIGLQTNTYFSLFLKFDMREYIILNVSAMFFLMADRISICGREFDEEFEEFSFVTI